MILDRFFRSPDRSDTYNSTAAYQRHLDSKLRLYPDNRDLAFADAIGSDTVELFEIQGDNQVAALKHHGLINGMAVYDLGCGCGRTAQALRRAGWRGRYRGADIIEGFVSELKRTCPGFEAVVHRKPTIVAEEDSLDQIFHWSVFTHISPEECFLYLEDSFRALKPGGKTIFSFLEMSDVQHSSLFQTRSERIRRGENLPILDTFLHRDWITQWATEIGFSTPAFVDGSDGANHPPTWQTVAVMVKGLAP